MRWRRDAHIARWRGTALAVLLAAALAACGEPPVPLDVPAARDGRAVLDLAGLGLAADPEVQDAISRAAAAGWDPVLVAFEDADASLGMADRAARKVLDAWDADVVLVAVAEPGHFTRQGDDRARYFGLAAKELRAVSRGLREHVVEELVPPLAADNRWRAAFITALDALVRDAAGGSAEPSGGDG